MGVEGHRTEHNLVGSGSQTFFRGPTSGGSGVGGEESASTQGTGGGARDTTLPRPPTKMASKQKLSKFTGDGKEDPVRHCQTCETIWTTNRVTDRDEWVQQFPATLRGVGIDWYSDTNKNKIGTWENLEKEFKAEFRLLQDDNEIVAEIYGTKQGAREIVCAYSRRLKELLGKMESQLADGLKK